MKISGKIWAVCMLLACGCLWSAGNVSAKVCFVGDSDCAGGADFGDGYTDDSEDLCKDVKDANGKLMYQKAPCAPKSHVSAVCPYNAAYVQCCGDSYAYSTCPYPLESVGRCGNSYKCACPKEKFPYASCPSPTIPGGINCLQIDDDSKTTSIHYEKCVCDPGLYPYKQNSDCDDNQIVDPKRTCTDTDGGTFYYRCKCPDSWSTCASMDGQGAIGARKCYSDGNTYHSQCCECPSPFERSMNDPYATDYEYCPCNNNFRKASGCKFGYKVDNGRCIEMTCGDALKALFDSSSAYSSYGLYTGNALSQKTLIVGDDVSSASWSHFSGKTVMSGAAFVKKLNGSNNYIKNVQEKCTNSIPTIQFTYSNSNITGTQNFTSVILKYTSSLWNKGSFTCTNCGIEFWKLYNTDSGATVNLAYNSNMPNADNMYVNATGIEISKPYRSVGYNYQVGSLGTKITNYGGNGAHVIMFEGKSNSNRMAFNGDYLTVNGLAAMKYANVRVGQTCIGTNCSYGSSSGVYFNPGDVCNTSSTLSLYYTNYYLYEAGTVRTVHMSTSTMLGKENDGTVSIVFSDASYNTLTFSQLWKYCSKRPGCAYRYITSYGSVGSRTIDCGYYSQSVRDGEKHSKPDDARCKIDGNNNQYGFAQASSAGCNWRDGDGSDRTPYFQLNGQRGWSRN